MNPQPPDEVITHFQLQRREGRLSERQEGGEAQRQEAQGTSLDFIQCPVMVSLGSV